MTRDVHVYADWEALPGYQKVGVLSAQTVRNNDVFRFAYDARWLADKNTIAIDPQLQLFSGNQFNSTGGNFGIFLDSCPDRWGRLLMNRREAIQARRENRRERKLGEIDYLLGVYDESRMGALRFKLDKDGSFLNDDRHQAAPPMTSLDQLAQAARMIEEDGDQTSDEYIQWLSLLISPGSSLGGARPKASVKDASNHLWIAKFPSRLDVENIGAWEYVAYLLARDAGIEMANCQIQQIGSGHHTFLTQRFDRTDSGRRKHFCSAMTLLGYKDGDVGQSYIELANFILENGSNSKSDMEQLFRRLVFNIAVSNTDDHLRNHGFIFENKGWRLSPAYDINPVSPAHGLHLNITLSDNSLDYGLALETAHFYRLNLAQAEAIVGEVKQAVSHWQAYASEVGLSRPEQARKRSAFNI